MVAGKLLKNSEGPLRLLEARGGGPDPYLKSEARGRSFGGGN